MPTSLKWIMPDDYEWLVAYELDEQSFNDLASASELEVKVAGESFTLVKDFKEPGGVMDPVLTHTYVTPEGSDRVLSVAVILDRRKRTATFNKTADSVSPSASVDDKQDKLVSGENIKTINGQSILGPGDLTIEGTDGYSYSKAEADERFVSKEELAANVEEEVSKIAQEGTIVQPPLVSGENIKTVNGESILGKGDLKVTVETATEDEILSLFA